MCVCLYSCIQMCLHDNELDCVNIFFLFSLEEHHRCHANLAIVQGREIGWSVEFILQEYTYCDPL